MISGISNGSDYMSYLQQTQTTQKKQGSPDLFTALDTDSSGGISQSELDTWAKSMSSETGKAMDTSNAISTYDNNSDGVLSSSELDSFLKANGLQPPSFQGMGQGPQDLFTALDTDSSGGISQSELDTWAKNMSGDTGKTIDTSKAISTYDGDGDGVLSSSELKSFLESNGIKAPEDGAMPPPPPPPASSEASSAETNSASTRAASIISSYDTNGDGVLSSSELQAYLENTEQSSSANSSNYLAQAISSYLMNMGQSMSEGASSYSYIGNFDSNINLSA
jgi:Ca2+-binding EF-hand superfamily protein